MKQISAGRPTAIFHSQTTPGDSTSRGLCSYFVHMPQIERIGRLKGPLTIRCYTCKHQATWPEREAWKKLGGETTTFDARRRLRCGACGEARTSRIDFL